MTHRQSFALLACLWLAACDGKAHQRSSVTVNLPPARPHSAAPGFSFDEPPRK